MPVTMGGVKLLAAAAMLLVGTMATGTGLVTLKPLVSDNILGQMAHACANSYCSSGVSGLDLWEYLAQVWFGLQVCSVWIVETSARLLY